MIFALWICAGLLQNKRVNLPTHPSSLSLWFTPHTLALTICKGVLYNNLDKRLTICIRNTGTAKFYNLEITRLSIKSNMCIIAG